MRQSRWTGITPAKRIALQPSSAKNKCRIGKSRKLEGKSRAASCQRNPLTFNTGPGHDKLGGHICMSGALRVPAATAEIRVGIGSDASMTAATPRPDTCSRSTAESDPMLFDEQVAEAERTKATPGAHGVLSACSIPATARRLTVGQAKRSDGCYSPQHGPSDVAVEYGNYAHAHNRDDAADSPPALPLLPSEAADPGYRLTHHVGGVERPLQLDFQTRGMHSASPTILPVNSPGEVQHAHAVSDAREVRIGHTSQNVGESHQSAAREHRSPHIIDSDEPWKKYLDVDASSSGQVRVGDGTGMSVPQPHIPAQYTTADCTTWPQHNTLGNLTHNNLVAVSTSVSAPPYRGQYFSPARPLQRTETVKEETRDEALWRSFAIGSDYESAHEIIHCRDLLSEDSMSRATKGYASTRLPLSAAVNSVSSIAFPSTPFKSLSGQASRISDDVQYAPHSTSRSITSVAPNHALWGRSRSPDGEDVPGGERGDKASSGCRFGEQSTHALLQNHTSHSSMVCNDARASDSDVGAWDDVSRRGQPSGSSVWHRSCHSSIWDSDDAGIDLVRVDSST